MFEPVSLHPESTSLGRGDVVVFYTDGATDVRPPNSLTASEFAALVEQAAAAGGTAEVVADRIHEALESILSFNRRDDDIALLVVRAVGE
jgi:serine phosphatase RsbU (regulator of sigma subunit)